MRCHQGCLPEWNTLTLVVVRHLDADHTLGLRNGVTKDEAVLGAGIANLVVLKGGEELALESIDSLKLLHEICLEVLDSLLIQEPFMARLIEEQHVVDDALVLRHHLQKNGIDSYTQAVEQFIVDIRVDVDDKVKVRVVEIILVLLAKDHAIGGAALEHNEEVGHEVPVDKYTGPDLVHEHFIELHAEHAVLGVLLKDSTSQSVSHGSPLRVLHVVATSLGIHLEMIGTTLSLVVRALEGLLDEFLAVSRSPDAIEGSHVDEE